MHLGSQTVLELEKIFLSCSAFYYNDSPWYCPVNCSAQFEQCNNHSGSGKKHALSVLLNQEASSFRQGSCNAFVWRACWGHKDVDEAEN